MRRILAALAASALPLTAVTAMSVTALPALAANPDDSKLTQLAGLPGCRAVNGYNDPVHGVPAVCQTDANVKFAWGVVVSPDDDHVYVATRFGGSVLSYSRASDGSLTPLAGTDACISDVAALSTNPGCAAANATGRQIDNLVALAISPDGKSVYTLKNDFTNSQYAVAVFDRNVTTGVLTQPAGAAGCFTEFVASGCTDSRALNGARGITVSPDNKTVIVASGGSNGIAVFDRNLTTGAIQQRAGADGCYTSSGAEGCTQLGGMSAAYGVAVSPDNSQVAVVSNGSDTLTILNRELDTQDVNYLDLSAHQCFDKTAGTCTLNNGLDGVQTVRYSADGQNLYTGSFPEGSGSNGIVSVFTRTGTTDTWTTPAGIAGCYSDTGGGGLGGNTPDVCTDLRRVPNVYELVVSADGKSVYVGGQGSQPQFFGNLAVLQRDPATGALSQSSDTSSCYDEFVGGAGRGTDARCVQARALQTTNGVAIAPDGKTVYATSQVGLSIYSRGTASSVVKPAKPDLSKSPKTVKVGKPRTFTYAFKAGKGLKGKLVLTKGTKTLLTKSFTVPSSGKVSLTLKISKATYRATKNAPVKAGVAVTVTNAAGSAKATKALTIKRK